MWLRPEELKLEGKSISLISELDGDVAQLVERWTGTSLRQVQFPGAARDIFSPELTFGADSLEVSAQPSLCNCMH